MVIECTECKTRFKLADEKVKPGGTKVRCSRCKHIFTVLPPIVQSVPTPPAAVIPLPDPPAENDDWVLRNDFSPSAAENESREEETSSGAGDFSVDFPPAGVPDQGDSEDDSFSFSTAHDNEAPGAFDHTEKDETVSPFSFSFEEANDSGGADAAFEKTDFTTEEQDFSWEAGDKTSPGEFDFGDAAAIDAGDFDFGRPTADSGDFDFGTPAMDSENFEAENERAPLENDFDFSSMTFGEEQPVKVDPPASDQPPPSPAAPFPPESLPEPFVPTESIYPPPPPLREVMAPPAQAQRQSPFSGLLIFLLVLLTVLTGAAGYFLWTGQKLDIPAFVAQFVGKPEAVPVVEQIRISGTTGSFVNNEEAGQLFVIQGTAKNEFPEARSAIAVKAVLYGKSGTPLLQQTVFCGNPLDEPALRTLPFARIEESMNNQFGDSLRNLNVATGKEIPFTIVFKKLPPDLAEFTVEVAESRPGSK